MEILCALGILAVVLTVLGQTLNFATSNHTYLRNKTLAVNDAKKVMEQVRLIADTVGLTCNTGGGCVADTSYWTNANNNGWTDIQSFSLAKPGISFPDGSNDPLHVRVTVNWTEKDAAKSYALDSLVTQRAYSG
ncbi:MAG: hypothetical protein HY582_04910 [Candidatus Omnitrophica bacterium]|nr:hypothetical protein [Candidatus Omnitrophota bacterium]